MVDQSPSKFTGSLSKLVPILEIDNSKCGIDHGSTLSTEGTDTIFENLPEKVELSHPPRISTDKEISAFHQKERTDSKIEEVHMFRQADSEPIDLNFEVGARDPSTCVDPSSSKNTSIKTSSRNHISKIDRDSRTGSRGPLSNLNMGGDGFSLGRGKASRPLKRQGGFKSRINSECGSRTASPEREKDALRVWKEMKENGFLSSSHGGIPAPKQRGRRIKGDSLKRRIELAKKEQVDKFAKLAAPTGLLNELNPGIINHVRNSKQVHSIIEALVKSEKAENPHFGSKVDTLIQCKNRDTHDRSKCAKNSKHSISCFPPCHSHDNDSRPSTSAVERKHSRSSAMVSREENHFIMKGEYITVEEGKRQGKSSLHGRDGTMRIFPSKLPPSRVVVPEATCSLSDEEFLNLSNIHFLSAKAATVASQWLELLLKDIEGRLNALQQSKNRLRAVIHTELPYLYSVEFSSEKENDPKTAKKSPHNTLRSTMEMHRERWGVLFSQMDKTLSEEEKQLENWLDEVKEMQTHCQWGLQHLPWNSPNASQEIRPSDKEPRLGPDLAVQAAAASIYSTCTYLVSTTTNNV